MNPTVLVRGGGDIASGIIYRLKRAHYPVVVSEITIPTMVRREVCYGNAVHKGEMILERFASRLVSLSEAKKFLNTKFIPVVTADYKEILEEIKPQIVVDAIIAKRNIGTRREDAEFVIGVGPGFEAPKDVDVVIETMRGHTLGRCIYDGSALPNTGIPGNVGGYTKERVIYAPGEGLFTAKRHIGEQVEAGEVIGYVDEMPVKTKITGRLRGILATGLMVTKGFKLGDVDARCEESNCFTISDKALAVGGGVMEAVLAWHNESLGYDKLEEGDI